MSSTSVTLLDFKAELEAAKKLYRLACEKKVGNYEYWQTHIVERLQPYVDRRNQALPNLVGAQGELASNIWKTALKDLGHEYELAERDIAEKTLADVELCCRLAHQIFQLQKMVAHKTQEYMEWNTWTDADLIQRFETGDLDYSIFITKSSEHARNIEKLYNAYKTLQPELHAPTREVIRRAAYEAHFQACKTPLLSIHWPRHRNEAGSNNDVTLASETAPAKLLDQVNPYTTLGPGGFLSRKLVPNEEIIANMRLRVPQTRDWNVASWLQATPELAIEAALLGGHLRLGSTSS